MAAGFVQLGAWVIAIVGTIVGALVGWTLADDVGQGGAIAIGFGIGLGSWVQASLLVLFVHLASNVTAIREQLSSFGRSQAQPDQDTGEWPLSAQTE